MFKNAAMGEAKKINNYNKKFIYYKSGAGNKELLQYLKRSVKYVFTFQTNLSQQVVFDKILLVILKKTNCKTKKVKVFPVI